MDKKNLGKVSVFKGGAGMIIFTPLISDLPLPPLSYASSFGNCMSLSAI